MTTTTATPAPRPARVDLSVLEVTKTLRAHQREWFADLRTRVIDGGEPFAISGPNIPHEIFEALDIHFVTDVWYSGMVAARRQSGLYDDFLTERGFHAGLSRYAALTLAVVMHEEHDDKAWGGIPPAQLVTGNLNDRSGEVLAEHWGVPYIGIEVPAARKLYPNWWQMSRHAWEDLDGTERIDVMAAQYQPLIAACEKIAGKKLDYDRLREFVDRVNRQEECFEEVRNLIRTAPKLPVRIEEVMSQILGINWHRGSEWALAQAQAFRDEVKARVENKQWVCENEKYRLMYIGAGLWQQMDFFSKFEESHGVVFARSNYLGFLCDGYLRYGLQDPIRTLGSRYSSFNRQMHIPPWSSSWHTWEAETFRISGALQIESGRGMKFIARMLNENGVPTLALPVDPVNANTWDEDKMRRLMVDFIEQRVIPAHERRREMML